MKPILISNSFDLRRLYTGKGEPLFSSDNLALFIQSGGQSIPNNNGLGVLFDAISCKTKHQLNGEDELTMTYPISGAMFNQIQLRDLIVANVERTRGNQPFRIYRITKPINGIITIYARHLAYDLNGIVVKPYSASNINAALSGLKSNSMTGNPFTFITSRSTIGQFKVPAPSSVWSLLGGQEGSLLDVYGGEYSFDEYNVRLENRVGSDSDVSVRYGVNMTDLEQDANCADCYTGVVAFWRSDDEVAFSPVMYSGGDYGYVKIKAVDMSDRFDKRPTVDQLKTEADIYIKTYQIGTPKVSWKVNFIPLDTTEEYKDVAILERVGLGDTVGVYFEKLGVNAKARVNEIEWDVLLDRYISVSLGSVRNNIADTIAGQARELSKVPNRAEIQSIAQRISETLTNAILGANGGSVRLLDTNDDGEPDTLYIADNPDPAQAVKVWRFNYEGWGASSNGYNGPFKMGATLNDGLLADFVTAANLRAGVIQSVDGKTFYLNLNSGEMRIGGRGLITSNDGKSSWDLSTGAIATYQDLIYKAADYTSDDVTRVTGIANRTITPTQADYQKYDFYKTGVITLRDRVYVSLLAENAKGDLTVRAQVNVSPVPDKDGGVLAVYRGVKWGDEDFAFSTVFVANPGAVFLMASGRQSDMEIARLDDFIVESGSYQSSADGFWLYEIYATGKARCVGNFLYSNQSTTDITGKGVLYRYNIHYEDIPPIFRSQSGGNGISVAISVHNADVNVLGVARYTATYPMTGTSTGGFAATSATAGSGKKITYTIEVTDMTNLN